MIKKLKFSEKQIFLMLFFVSTLSFSIKFIGGLRSESVALINHSYDMLIDSVVSGLSLFAIKREREFQENLALLKGGMLGLFGIISFFSLFEKFFNSYEPLGSEMFNFGIYSIILNLVSILFIARSRNESLLLKSSWLACKMDLMVNVFVLVGAYAVERYKTNFPDLLLSGFISYLFVKAFLEIYADWKKSRKQLIQQTT
jgi:Co/Zn/Cd efflux system component